MADAELNPEEFPEVPAGDQTAAVPSALDVLERIEAERAAETAGSGGAGTAVADTLQPESEKAAEAGETVKVVNVVDASQPEPEKVDPKAKKAAELEGKRALVKRAQARCEEIDAEVKALEKSIKELNEERTKLLQLIKHNREVIRPSLHELNKEQAKITAAERDRRYAALDLVERLGPHLQSPRSYPPKFKIT